MVTESSLASRAEEGPASSGVAQFRLIVHAGLERAYDARQVEVAQSRLNPPAMQRLPVCCEAWVCWYRTCSCNGARVTTIPAIEELFMFVGPDFPAFSSNGPAVGAAPERMAQANDLEGPQRPRSGSIGLTDGLTNLDWRGPNRVCVTEADSISEKMFKLAKRNGNAKLREYDTVEQAREAVRNGVLRRADFARPVTVNTTQDVVGEEPKTVSAEKRRKNAATKQKVDFTKLVGITLYPQDGGEQPTISATVLRDYDPDDYYSAAPIALKRRDAAGVFDQEDRSSSGDSFERILPNPEKMGFSLDFIYDAQEVEKIQRAHLFGKDARQGPETNETSGADRVVLTGAALDSFYEIFALQQLRRTFDELRGRDERLEKASPDARKQAHTVIKTKLTNAKARSCAQRDEAEVNLAEMKRRGVVTLNRGKDSIVAKTQEEFKFKSYQAILDSIESAESGGGLAQLFETIRETQINAGHGSDNKFLNSLQVTIADIDREREAILKSDKQQAELSQKLSPNPIVPKTPTRKWWQSN